jgi:hypothetical protein
MSLFGNRKPQPRPQDPGIAPFRVGEYATPAPAVLDPVLVNHEPGRVVDVQHTDNPKDPLGPWLITIEWPNGWQAMFSAAELTRFKGLPDHARTRIDPTPLYDQVKEENDRILAEHADELASIGDRIESDLRSLTRRNQRRAAVRREL